MKMTTDQIKGLGLEQNIVQDNSKKNDIFVNLTINQEVLIELKRESIDINQLFILLALYDNHIDLLDSYDEKNSKRKVVVLEYQDLYIHGFIEESKGDVLYNLTDKGRQFVDRITPLFTECGPAHEAATAFDLKTLCSKYLDLWPKIKLPSGIYARVNIVEIEKKMRNFLANYRVRFKKDYGIILTEEDILSATKAYIDRYAKENYKFMANSSYFIQKHEKSGLADEIIANKQGINKPKTNIVGM